MLSERASWLRERMDDPDCDPLLLRNTYRQFARVNALVTGWRRVFDRSIAPRLGPGTTILDVGCGGGDLAWRLLAWSRRAGAEVTVTAIDPDQRAVEFARAVPTSTGAGRSRVGQADTRQSRLGRADTWRPPSVDFRQSSAEDLLSTGERFDVVVSNHLLHHFADTELQHFLETTAVLAKSIAVHNDMCRHPVAYGAFALTRPFFPRSFIVEDGLRSIRRAFTPQELRQLVPRDWQVRTLVPFRNLVILEK